MEARQEAELPRGPGWQYEPKWDGFRCLARCDGEEVELLGRSGKSLSRYFPDIVAALHKLSPRRFVLDGELVIPVGNALSFDELQMRLHPAASRVQKLAAAHPALFIAFDLLRTPRGTDISRKPLAERRTALEAFSNRHSCDFPRQRAAVPRPRNGWRVPAAASSTAWLPSASTNPIARANARW